MLKSFTLVLALQCLAFSLFAQAYPLNPEEGACYIRCPKEFVKRNVVHTVRRAYKDFKVVPATYKTVEEQVLVKPASKRFEYVPAVYREVFDSILIEEPIHKISLKPIRTIDTIEVREIQPAYSRFESRPAYEGCKSQVPGDCDVICYVRHEAIKKEFPVKKIVSDPLTIKEVQKGKYKRIKRKEVVSEATVREIEIPAEYITIQKKVLLKDETLDTIYVGPITQDVPVLTLDENSSSMEANYEWKKIDCKLLDFNILPIYYEFNSALLDRASKKVIDEKIYELMVQRPELRIEINSHTDSRASDDFNLDLSTRRAKSVVDYLVQKGIKRSRLEYNGLGETRLVNHCANGAECSEEEHARNRRTEFRVLPR